MSIIADYHLHSDHSGDSSAAMEVQILSGIERGLRYMCFTEHYDPEFPYENNPEVVPGSFELDYSLYRKEFMKMKERFEGEIELGFGVELGLQPHLLGGVFLLADGGGQKNKTENKGDHHEGDEIVMTDVVKPPQRQPERIGQNTVKYLHSILSSFAFVVGFAGMRFIPEPGVIRHGV